MAVLLGYASIDENGSIGSSDSLPGNQTGKELKISDWYNRKKGWSHVFRPKDTGVAERIAHAAEAACNNMHTGYNHKRRTTLYDEAKRKRWDLAAIDTYCETDCSALCAVCINAAGIEISKYLTSSSIDLIPATGQFDTITSKQYVTTSDYLKRGDILRGPGHMAIVLSNGVNVHVSSDVSLTYDRVDSEAEQQDVPDADVYNPSVYIEPVLRKPNVININGQRYTSCSREFTQKQWYNLLCGMITALQANMPTFKRRKSVTIIRNYTPGSTILNNDSLPSFNENKKRLDLYATTAIGKLIPVPYNGNQVDGAFHVTLGIVNTQNNEDVQDGLEEEAPKFNEIHTTLGEALRPSGREIPGTTATYFPELCSIQLLNGWQWIEEYYTDKSPLQLFRDSMNSGNQFDSALSMPIHIRHTKVSTHSKDQFIDLLFYVKCDHIINGQTVMAEWCVRPMTFTYSSYVYDSVSKIKKYFINKYDGGLYLGIDTEEVPELPYPSVVVQVEGTNATTSRYTFGSGYGYNRLGSGFGSGGLGMRFYLFGNYGFRVYVYTPEGEPVYTPFDFTIFPEEDPTYIPSMRKNYRQRLSLKDVINYVLVQEGSLTEHAIQHLTLVDDTTYRINTDKQLISEQQQLQLLDELAYKLVCKYKKEYTQILILNDDLTFELKEIPNPSKNKQQLVLADHVYYHLPDKVQDKEEQHISITDAVYWRKDANI